jgi:hypothetical protein
MTSSERKPISLSASSTPRRLAGAIGAHRPSHRSCLCPSAVPSRMDPMERSWPLSPIPSPLPSPYRRRQRGGQSRLRTVLEIANTEHAMWFPRSYKRNKQISSRSRVSSAAFVVQSACSDQAMSPCVLRRARPLRASRIRQSNEDESDRFVGVQVRCGKVTS